MKIKVILIALLVLTLNSCESPYHDNLYKLGERVIIEGDTLQVIDVSNYYLHLSDGRKVDVHYPIIKQ